MTTTKLNPTSDPTTVLVVGATGWLGRQITQELSATGHPVRIGLRHGTEHPAADELAALAGTDVVELDLTRPETLPRAVDGASVVVSAIQGGPELLVDGQEALARAAKAGGVQRIFPSDFAVDYTHIPDEDHLFFSWRRHAQQAIAAVGLAQTNTYNGAFTEMLLPQPFLTLVDFDDGTVLHWGSADQVYDFTTTADVARYVAAAALDPHAPDGPLKIAGDSLSPIKLAEAINRSTGRSFTTRQLGTLEQLDAEIARRQAAAPGDPNAWVALQYLRAMASGDGQLHELHNARYPQIEPTGVADFIARHQDQTTGPRP